MGANLIRFRHVNPHWFVKGGSARLVLQSIFQEARSFLEDMDVRLEVLKLPT